MRYSFSIIQVENSFRKVHEILVFGYGIFKVHICLFNLDIHFSEKSMCKNLTAFSAIQFAMNVSSLSTIPSPAIVLTTTWCITYNNCRVHTGSRFLAACQCPSQITDWGQATRDPAGFPLLLPTLYLFYAFRSFYSCILVKRKVLLDRV